MTRKLTVFLLVSVLLLTLTKSSRYAWAQGPVLPAAYIVSPAGTPGGDGSGSDPIDLVTALSSGTPAKGGDTLELRGGVYRGAFTSTLTGTEGRPITVRPFSGERVRIDGSLTVRGAWATYLGLEVMNSSDDRTKSRPAGVDIYGAHTRFINLVVHDAGGSGMNFWSAAVDAEIYGCVIYHNGWQGPDPDRGHGHGIYTQNQTGTKRIMDNILFDQFGWGIHAYTEGGSLKGFDLEGNVAFNNGSATRQSYRYDNILVGGLRPAEHVTLISNYTYHTPGQGGKNRLGYSAANKDVVVKDNYFAEGSPALALLGWENVIMRGNTFAGSGSLLAVAGPKGAAELRYEIDDNTYIGGAANPFTFQSQTLDFAGWQKATGFDRNGRWMPGDGNPSGVKVFVRPNQYEAGRAHVIVYNWDHMDAVKVDLKTVLSPGASYEVRNVLDYYALPAVKGTYTGGDISLPMTGSETGPEFNVFVVTATGQISPVVVHSTH